MYRRSTRHFSPPEAALDQKLARLSVEAQLLWHRLHSDAADDQGRFIADPRHLKATCAPLIDEIDAGVIGNALGELVEAQHVVMYQVDGDLFGQIIHWWRYQTGKYAYPSDHPAPPGWVDATYFKARIGKVTKDTKHHWPPDHEHGTSYLRECPEALRLGPFRQRSANVPGLNTQHPNAAHASAQRSNAGQLSARQFTFDATSSSNPSFAAELEKIEHAQSQEGLTVAQGSIELADLTPDERTVLHDAVKLRLQELEDE